MRQTKKLQIVVIGQIIIKKDWLGVYQRWSPRGRPWPRGRPRGHILKSLALASKVKSLALASRPQVLENWLVLGSRTALLFELLKFCEALEKFFGRRFFAEIESVCRRKGCPWPWPRVFFVSLALASSLVSSTPPLVFTSTLHKSHYYSSSVTSRGFYLK